MTASPDGRQKAKHTSEGQRGQESGSSVKSLRLADLQDFGSIKTLGISRRHQFSLEVWSENYSAAVV